MSSPIPRRRQLRSGACGEPLERRLLFANNIDRALDLPGGVLSTYSGDPAAVDIQSEFTRGGLLGFPSGLDSDFLVLSTGDASSIRGSNSSGSQGTDLGDSGVAGDTATVSFTLPVPVTNRPQKLKFDFMFLSEEYPEYVGSRFNDIFSATVNGAEVAIDQNGNPINVNSVLFSGVEATGTYFDGRSSLLTASYIVDSGASSLNVVFTIGDVGDGVYDSAVMLDNVRFEQRQLVFLNFNGQSVGNHFGGATSTSIPAFTTADLSFPQTGAGQTLASVVQEIFALVQGKYAAYDIDFTLDQPAGGTEFSTVVIGGSNGTEATTFNPVLIGAFGTHLPIRFILAHRGIPDVVLGLAKYPIDVGNKIKNDLAVVLSAEHNLFADPAQNVASVVNTIIHELGHNLGLRHVSPGNSDDVMVPGSPTPASAAFPNALHGLDRASGWPDGATEQNSDAYLRGVLGTKNGGSSISPGSQPSLFDTSFNVALTKPIYDVDIEVNGFGAAATTDGGDLGISVLHFDVLSPGQTITLPFAPAGATLALTGATVAGGTINIFSGTPTAGSLTPEAQFVPLFDSTGAAITSFPLSAGVPGRLVAAKPLGLVASTLQGVSLLPRGIGVFTDTDGDRYIVRLIGPGGVAVVQEDPSATGRGPISQVVLQGTDALRSRLLIVTVRARGGDGAVQIGEVSGTGLAGLIAPAGDLTGAGVSLTGGLGALLVRDISNGATVSSAAGNVGPRGTVLVSRNVGDGSVFNIGTAIGAFVSKSVGKASITAPSIGRILDTGAFGADITTSTLTAAVILGRVSGARWTFNGNVGAITAGAIIDSTIYNGVTAGATGLLTSASQFSGAFTIGRIIVTGVRGDPVGFANSFLAANRIGAVVVTNPQPVNGGIPFGLATTHLTAIVLRQGNAVIFRWSDRLDPALLVPQGDATVSLL